MNSNDDIVTLLRKYQPYNKLHGQAADEIERLRAENQNWKEISDGWWQFHLGKISPEEMCGLLLKVDSTAKRPIPGYYDN